MNKGVQNMHKWTVYYQDGNWWGEMLTEDRIYKTDGYQTIDKVTDAINAGDYDYDTREKTHWCSMANMQKQVFSYVSMMWMDVVSENETTYGIVDFDGINTVVIKDGTEKVRMIDK